MTVTLGLAALLAPAGVAQTLRDAVEVNHRSFFPSGEGPFPTVVAIPGCSGVSLEGPATDEGRPGDEADRLFRRHYARMAERLRGGGFGVVLVDYLTAEGVANTCRNEISHERVGEYVAAGLAFARTLPHVDRSRLFVIGWSHGGAGVIAWLQAVGETKPPVAGVVAVYPGCNNRDAWVTPVPVLVLLGEADDITPPESCAAILTRLPERQPVRIRRYADARHGFDMTEGPEILSVGGGLTVGRNPTAGDQAWEEIFAFLGSGSSSRLGVAESPTPAESVPAVRRIPIETPSGRFEVWTRRVGRNPGIKVLLLHGGPGASHEYLLNFEEHLPQAGIELYFYDQLGSHHSDRPDDPDLWTVERFVDEVEQVRRALGLDVENFFLYGHSWGGLLALEYALEHQENLRGLIISNNMASYPAYNDYAKDVLMAAMDSEVLAELEALEASEAYDDPRYMELLTEHHYEDHVLRRPIEEWPDFVNAAFKHLNASIYVPLQGPSELGVRGLLENWDRTADLRRVTVPTLVIGATYDTMDPKHMEWMAAAIPKGRFLLCPEGSHFSHIDDERVYFEGLIRFLKDVDGGTFTRP